MADFIQEADRAMGVELELEELVERRERAEAQGMTDEVAELNVQIEDLYDLLAAAGEAAATSATQDLPGPVVHGADELGITEPS